MKSPTAKAVLLLGLLLATPAHATVFWLSSFEHGLQQPGATPTPDSKYWTTQNGNAQTTTAGVDSIPGGGRNRFAMRFQPASGGTNYLVPVTAAGASPTTMKLTGSFKMSTLSTGAVRDLLSFGDASAAGHYTQGCMVAQQYATTLLGVRYYTLNLYYGSPSATVCSGSSANGRRCTAVTDCPAVGDPNEPQCSAATMGSSPIIAEGTQILITLTQDNGTGATAGTVTCGLYEGVAGTAPAAYARASTSRRVGFCAAGGANTNLPCDVNGDCPSATCTLTDLVSPKTVNLGTATAGTGAMDYQWDWAVLYDGTAMPNGYVEVLDPSAQGVTTGNTNWTHVGSARTCADGTPLWDCLNDTTVPDGDTSAIENNNPFGTKPTAVFSFATPIIPSASPTPRAVALEYTAEDRSGSGITMRLLPMVAGTVTPNPAPTGFDFTTFQGSGSITDPYYLAPQILWERNFTYAELQTLKAEVKKTVGGSGDNGRVSGLTASVFYQLANPVIANTIPDRDQDGVRTVCLVGDSTWDNVDFQNAVVANVVQADNIYFYTRGGSKVWDALAELTLLVEGTTGTFLGVDVRRGTSGATCDVILVEQFSNSFTGGTGNADPKNPATYEGVPRAGFCEDNGGSNQGNACYCTGTYPGLTSNYTGTPAPNITPGAHYCANNGAFKQVCGLNSDCHCTSAAGCSEGRATPGPSASPAVCATSISANCTSSACCLFTGFPKMSANAPSYTRLDHCVPGCLNATGCSSGICIRTPQEQDRAQSLVDFAAGIAARPTPVQTPPLGGPPLVVYLAPPPGHATGIGVWPTVWDQANRFRSTLVSWAVANSQSYIDMFARFQRACPMEVGCAAENACTDTENVTYCYRDGNHWTYRGQVVVAADVVTKCLTKDGANNRTHDGVCTSSVCSDGLVGKSCAAAADCDTWSCNFGL